MHAWNLSGNQFNLRKQWAVVISSGQGVDAESEYRKGYLDV